MDISNPTSIEFCRGGLMIRPLGGTYLSLYPNGDPLLLIGIDPLGHNGITGWKRERRKWMVSFILNLNPILLWVAVCGAFIVWDWLLTFRSVPLRATGVVLAFAEIPLLALTSRGFVSSFWEVVQDRSLPGAGKVVLNLVLMVVIAVAAVQFTATFQPATRGEKQESPEH